MPRLLAALFALFVWGLGGCVAYPYPYGYTVPVPAQGPSSFDRSWDAALGAAADAGVQVTSANRETGRIIGNRAGASVVISLQWLTDGSLQVSFEGPEVKDGNPTLGDRWLAAYQQRMRR